MAPRLPYDPAKTVQDVAPPMTRALYALDSLLTAMHPAFSAAERRAAVGRRRPICDGICRYTDGTDRDDDDDDDDDDGNDTGVDVRALVDSVVAAATEQAADEETLPDPEERAAWLCIAGWAERISTLDVVRVFSSNAPEDVLHAVELYLATLLLRPSPSALVVSHESQAGVAFIAVASAGWLPLVRRFLADGTFGRGPAAARHAALALVAAAEKGRRDVVQLLAAQVALTQDEKFDLAVAKAMQNGHTGIVDVLMCESYGLAKPPSLGDATIAAKRGHLSSVRWFVGAPEKCAPVAQCNCARGHARRAFAHY